MSMVWGIRHEAACAGAEPFPMTAVDALDSWDDCIGWRGLRCVLVASDDEGRTWRDPTDAELDAI